MCLVRLNKRRAAELAPVRRHGLGAHLVDSRVLSKNRLHTRDMQNRDGELKERGVPVDTNEELLSRCL